MKEIEHNRLKDLVSTLFEKEMAKKDEEDTSAFKPQRRIRR